MLLKNKIGVDKLGKAGMYRQINHIPALVFWSAADCRRFLECV
jgi:hypothetical protein